MYKQKPKINGNYNFSRNLRDLREIAITMTENPKLRVKYNKKADTSSIDLETYKITLSLNPYPDWVKNRDRLAKKILSGDLAHECGHEIVSFPVWERYNAWVTKIKRNRGYFKLAHEIVGIVEDKRINHFIELRYRHDFGKRLKLANLIIKDTIETAIKQGKVLINTNYGEAPLIIAVLSNYGLYEADKTFWLQNMSKKAKEATNKALDILESIKYKRLGMELIRASQEIYDLIEPFIPKGGESKLKKYMPSRKGGEIKGELSEELKELLEEAIKREIEKEEEEEKEKLLKDLLKGEGAGQGTGEEIPAPEPNFEAYQALVDRNKPEITRLLNKLKEMLKPLIKRANFQNRGRIMPQILGRAFVNSLRTEVKNVYLNFKTRFEKEKVAIGFLFDYSGSVDRKDAEDITTILTEVFGAYVDDSGYSVSVFGANQQKIKTFFELHDNTKARIGNIGVSACGTEITPLLKAYLKMFNTVSSNRRKILVIASDFWFGDDSDARDMIKLFPKANVELIFIGFSSCEKVHEWASDLVKARRTEIKDVKDFPEAFLDVYLGVQKPTSL